MLRERISFVPRPSMVFRQGMCGGLKMRLGKDGIQLKRTPPLDRPTVFGSELTDSAPNKTANYL